MKKGSRRRRKKIGIRFKNHLELYPNVYVSPETLFWSKEVPFVTKIVTQANVYAFSVNNCLFYNKVKKIKFEFYNDKKLNNIVKDLKIPKFSFHVNHFSLLNHSISNQFFCFNPHNQAHSVFFFFFQISCLINMIFLSFFFSKN